VLLALCSRRFHLLFFWRWSDQDLDSLNLCAGKLRMGQQTLFPCVVQLVQGLEELFGFVLWGVDKDDPLKLCSLLLCVPLLAFHGRVEITALLPHTSHS